MFAKQILITFQFTTYRLQSTTIIQSQTKNIYIYIYKNIYCIYIYSLEPDLFLIFSCKIQINPNRSGSYFVHSCNKSKYCQISQFLHEQNKQIFMSVFMCKIENLNSEKSIIFFYHINVARVKKKVDQFQCCGVEPFLISYGSGLFKFGTK